MELALVIYFIELMSKLSIMDFGFMVGTYALVVCFGTLIIGFIWGLIMERSLEQIKETFIPYKKFFTSATKWVFGLYFLLSIFSFLAPSKETSYTMLAAYGVQSVATNTEVQQVAGKSLKVLERYMDEYLEESQDDPEKSQ